MVHSVGSSAVGGGDGGLLALPRPLAGEGGAGEGGVLGRLPSLKLFGGILTQCCSSGD